MRDIGMHPDHRSMHPDLKNYEKVSGCGFKCPWCEEELELAHELQGLFQLAIEETTEEDEYCGNCGAKLKITYLFVPLAAENSAEVDAEVTAVKRIA